jgi:hypothetical protein
MYRLSPNIEKQLYSVVIESEKLQKEISGHIDEKDGVISHNTGTSKSTSVNLSVNNDFYFHTHPSNKDLSDGSIVNNVLPPSGNDISNILECHKSYNQSAEAIACPLGYWIVIPKQKIYDLLDKDLVYMYFILLCYRMLYGTPDDGSELDLCISNFCDMASSIHSNIVPDINTSYGMFALNKCMEYKNVWKAREVFKEYQEKLSTLQGVNFVDIYFYKWNV